MIKSQRNKRDLKELGCIVVAIVIAAYLLLAYLAFWGLEAPVDLEPIPHNEPTVRIMIFPIVTATPSE